MTQILDDATADPWQIIADLQRKLDERTAELVARTSDLQESLEYQTATSDVLKVISRSTFDLQPVLDTLAETAARLCDAGYTAIFRRDGEVYRIATVVAFSPETMEAAIKFQAFLEQHPLVPGRGSIVGRVALEGRAVHVADTASDPEYILGEAKTLGNIRTQLGVPLLREGEPIGVIILARQRVQPFTDRQIELVRTFADQAVIAIENARLITETREALEQQTATAEVLQVINASPGDLGPVFEAMLDKALRLCGANFGLMNTYDGEHFHHAADHGVPATYAKFRRDRGPTVYGSGTTPARLVAGEGLVHTIDLMATEPYEQGDPARRALVDLGGARSHLTAALRKGDILLGDISIYRQDVHPFTGKQIALLQNFAAQAVIAIENARLITETRDRTRDLQESLEYQTATSDVLKVISGSVFELQPVLDTVVATAVRLCRADHAGIYRNENGVYRWVAGYAQSPEYERVERAAASVMVGLVERPVAALMLPDPRTGQDARRGPSRRRHPKKRLDVARSRHSATSSNAGLPLISICCRRSRSSCGLRGNPAHGPFAPALNTGTSKSRRPMPSSTVAKPASPLLPIGLKVISRICG